ncbi:ABC-three component system protein [Kitasatospora sp. NPDC092039]|uniref:ABC-three component system protein n=1 Tax=Kitasatospora sp. NPDC092039 TaxID=3364086 RepID=UPI0038014C8A
MARKHSYSYETEPLFTDLPLPSQTPVTVLSPMMAPPPHMTPKQILMSQSAEQWEEFVREWLLALKGTGYIDVVGMGGANDRGADVAAFLTQRKTDGPWHCFQCKRYERSLTPAIAYPEMLKILAAVAVGRYREFPERYVFVAPRIGASLVQLLAKPGELKDEFLRAVAPGSRLSAEYDDDTLAAALDLAQVTDFSCFEAANLDKILEQHAEGPYHAQRFGTPLKPRPATGQPPMEHTANEARYIQLLLEVYEERWGCPADSPLNAQAHPRAGRHLQSQREAFFCADALRVFARDSVPPGTFEALQDDIYNRVADFELRDFPNGYERLNKVLDTAGDMPLANNILVDYVHSNDRKGICHQLANDDRLTWCPKEGS